MSVDVPPHDRIRRVTEFLGWEWDTEKTDLLAQYGRWVVGEGLQIGGIGPAEVPRVWDRHILDALVFGWDCPPGASILDAGSGIGLPGIPLAIALPDATVTLLERSGRRADALHRVNAMLGLGVNIAETEAKHATDEHDRVVLRASLTLPETLRWAPRRVSRRGEVWFGLGRGETSDAVEGWRRRSPPVPPGWNTELRRTPDGVLDSPAWLLRIYRW